MYKARMCTKVLLSILVAVLSCTAQKTIEIPVKRRPGGKDASWSRDGARGRSLHFEETFSKRENDGVYWADIRIGTPPQTFSVIVDTGSSTIAIPCLGCNCGAHNHFDPKSSSTDVTTRQGGYSQCYSEGSCNRGDLVQDLVCIGEHCDTGKSVRHAFGCCSTFAAAFRRQEADGIIGLSLRDATLVSDLRNHHKLDKDMFSLCFGQVEGRIAVGGFPEERHLEPIQWTKMTGSGEFYNVKLEGMYVDGKKLKGDTTTIMVDSGTTFTYVPRAYHSALKNAVDAFCLESPGKHCAGTKNPSNTPPADKRDAVACFQYPGESTMGFTDWLDTFPHIEIEMTGAKICLPSSQYFFASTKDIYCIGLFPDHRFIIGAINMAEFDVIFNHKDNTIGWARANCDGEADEPASPVSCCGSCAEHNDFKDKTLKPHVEKHELSYTVSKLKNGRLKLVPKPESGLVLSGVSLKSGDDLWLDMPGKEFILCADNEPCSFAEGSTIYVAKNTVASFGSANMEILGSLFVQPGASVKFVHVTFGSSTSQIRIENLGSMSCTSLGVEKGMLVMRSGASLRCSTTIDATGVLQLPATQIAQAPVAELTGPLELKGKLELEAGGVFGKLQVHGKVSLQGCKVKVIPPAGIHRLAADYFMNTYANQRAEDYVLLTTEGELHGPIDLISTELADNVLLCSKPQVVQYARYVAVDIPNLVCLDKCLKGPRDMQSNNDTEVCLNEQSEIVKLFEVDENGLPIGATTPTQPATITETTDTSFIPFAFGISGFLMIFLISLCTGSGSHKYTSLQ